MLYPRQRKSAKAPVIKFQLDPEKEKSELKKVTLTLFAKPEDLMKSCHPIQVNISFRIKEFRGSLWPALKQLSHFCLCNPWGCQKTE